MQSIYSFRRFFPRIILAFCLLQFGPLCSNGQSIDSASFLEAKNYINKINEAYESDMIQGNFKAIASPYGADGVFVASDGKTIIGADNIEEFYRQRAPVLKKIASIRLKQEGITAAGPYIYEWGLVNFVFGKEANMPDRSGRYLTVWKKTGQGKWQIIRNITLA